MKPLPPDPDESAMAKVHRLFAASGLSLLELGLAMGYPEASARQAAWRFMQAKAPQRQTLRKFADAIGLSADEFSPRKNEGQMAKRLLKNELADYGCDWDPDLFRDLLREQKQLTTPTWSIDELVCNPTDALRYCDHIRRSCDCEWLPDSFILRALMNTRRNN